MANIQLNIQKNDFLDLAAHQLNHYASIVDIQSWQEVLNSYLEIKQQVQPKKVFLVLDDIHQAEYTAMHAIEDDRLYFNIEDECSDVDINDPKFEQWYQNVGIFNELHHYSQQLQQPIYQQKIQDLTKKMQYYSEDDLYALLRFNQQPLAIVDTEIQVKIADIETEALKLAMLPNGYFSCDFDPFENFTIIQHIQNYGFEFIGLGAMLLGWIKTSDFKSDQIDHLIQDLVMIYPLNISNQNILKELILENNYLILPYSESPQEYLGYDLS